MLDPHRFGQQFVEAVAAHAGVLVLRCPDHDDPLVEGEEGLWACPQPGCRCRVRLTAEDGRFDEEEREEC